MLESVRQMRKFIVMLYETAGKKFKTGISELMFGKYEEEEYEEEEEDTLCDQKNRWRLLIVESSVGD